MEKISKNGSRLIKIAITGPESTGKSWLSENLAQHYSTSYAPEFARNYLSILDITYSIEDLDKIALGQLENERKAIQTGNKIVFFDTDFLVMKIWSEFRFGRVSQMIQDLYYESNYDHILLCFPDLEWEQDSLRESPSISERLILFKMYLAELQSNHSSNFSIIKGKGQARLNSAIDSVNTLF